MKQWNLLYEDEASFHRFVVANRLMEADGLLIQILAGLSDTKKLQEIQNSIAKILPQAVVAGMGSALQMCDGEYYFDRTLLVVTRFDSARPTLWHASFPLPSQFDAQAFAMRLAAGVKEDTKGILLYTNAVTSDIEDFTAHYQKLVNIPVFGGIATSFDQDNPCPYVIAGREIYEDDAVVAVFLTGESLQIFANYLFPWQSIGKEFTVTRAEGKRLYELDGVSIKEVYERYFGPMDREKLLYLSLAHPLIRHSDIFGEVSRVLLEYDGESGIYTGIFKEGEKVRIGFGDYQKMTQCASRTLQIFKEVPTEAFWSFFCISYTRGYDDLMRKLFAPYRKNLEAMSVAITFGEFAWVEGRNAFLNNAIVKIHLSEDPERRFVGEEQEFSLDEKDRLLETLSTLVSSSSREIIDLNRHLEREVEKRTRELATLNASLERRVALEVKKNREKDKMLFHQSKLAAMGEMINNIAHQWRQPLNIIALVMQDLSLKAQIGDLSAESVMVAERKIGETLKYLSDTIDDFRSFASQGEEYTHPEWFDVGRSVKEALRLVAMLLDAKRIRVEVSIPDEEALVMGRPNDLKQVLLNLVYNAVDVLKEKAPDDPFIGIELSYDDRVRIEVCDNGGGVPPELTEKIFEPYFTTKYQARGTGLGLFMSRMIVQKRLSGTLTMRNLRDGACFILSIPCVPKKRGNEI